MKKEGMFVAIYVPHKLSLQTAIKPVCWKIAANASLGYRFNLIFSFSKGVCGEWGRFNVDLRVLERLSLWLSYIRVEVAKWNDYLFSIPY